MSTKLLLTLGRNVGVENFTQLKNFLKGVSRTSVGNTQRATINLTTKQLEDSVRLLNDYKPGLFEGYSTVSEVAAKYAPRAYAPNTLHHVDLSFAQPAESKCIFGFATESKDAAGLVTDANGFFSYAPDGVKLGIYSNSEAGKIDYVADILTDALHPVVPDVSKLMQFTDNNGVRTIVSNVENLGAIRKLVGRAELPVEYIEDITKVSGPNPFLGT